ncbi:MAG: Hpt domain-containing protein [Bacteroidales bacterium]
MIDYSNPTQLLAFPQINPESLEKLRISTATQPQLLKDIFNSYVMDSRELLQEMREHSANGNMTGFYAAVHSLKGLAGTIGCTRMFQLLKWMDSLNKEEHFADSAAKLEDLEQIFLDLEREVNLQILNK